MSARRPAAWLLAGAAVAAGLTWLRPAPPADAPTPMPAAQRPPATPEPAAAAPLPPAAAAERSADEIGAALYRDGSLRGSAPDGGWPLDAAGRLRPALAVRRRFDHLLTATGEADLPELGRLLQAQASRELPPAALAELMQLWQRYVQLQQTRYRHAARLHEPAAWQAALEERVRRRRELLGPAWADAFYLDEETALRAQIAATIAKAAPVDATGVPPLARAPAAGVDTAGLQAQRSAAFGAEAAGRLAALDAAQARWAERIAETRHEIRRLQETPELSAPQRAEAIERLVAEAFAPGEQRRARAVLGLPGTPG